MKFKSQQEDPVNGNDFVHSAFGGKAGKSARRHKHFKCFFACVNPLYPTPPRETHPNWKVQPLLKHMLDVSKKAMVMGYNLSVDEQTIGFQGQHKDKQRITYKKVGDGFLVDALSSEGYTYTWYFRNQIAPKVWTDKGLSPLHSRVMSLFQQIPNKSKNYRCGMDNLFISPKFAKICLNQSGRRIMIHGVCREN